MTTKPLPKDSLARIVKIMEYIEENYEKINVNDIKNKFGENGWHLFSRYCIGTKEDYATSVSNKNGTAIYNLTGVGIRRLHELRKILSEEKRLKLQINTNIIIAITAATLAVIASINLAISLFGVGSTANQLLLFIIVILIGGVTGAFLVFSLKLPFNNNL